VNNMVNDFGVGEMLGKGFLPALIPRLDCAVVEKTPFG